MKLSSTRPPPPGCIFRSPANVSAALGRASQLVNHYGSHSQRVDVVVTLRRGRKSCRKRRRPWTHKIRFTWYAPRRTIRACVTCHKGSGIPRRTGILCVRTYCESTGAFTLPVPTVPHPDVYCVCVRASTRCGGTASSRGRRRSALPDAVSVFVFVFVGGGGDGGGL